MRQLFLLWTLILLGAALAVDPMSTNFTATSTNETDAVTTITTITPITTTLEAVDTTTLPVTTTVLTTVTTTSVTTIAAAITSAVTTSPTTEETTTTTERTTTPTVTTTPTLATTSILTTAGSTLNSTEGTTVTQQTTITTKSSPITKRSPTTTTTTTRITKSMTSKKPSQAAKTAAPMKGNAKKNSPKKTTTRASGTLALTVSSTTAIPLTATTTTTPAMTTTTKAKVAKVQLKKNHKTATSKLAPTTVTTTTPAATTTTTKKTTTTTSTTTTTEPHFPYKIFDPEHGVRVRQCSCDDTQECAREARTKLGDCRLQCSILLDSFGGKNISERAAMDCFGALGDELSAVDNCVTANVGDFCVSDASTVSYIVSAAGEDALPAFAAYHASSSEEWEKMVTSGYRGGAVAVKKARQAFARLRDFQMCAWKCVLRTEANCQAARRCVAKYPPADSMHEILAGCDAARFHEHSVDTCRCLLREHGVRKLTGLCPLVRNRHFMVRI